MSSERAFEDLPFMMAMIDRDRRILAMTGTFTRWLGYGNEDIKNTPVLDLAHPEDRDELAALLSGSKSASVNHALVISRFMKEKAVYTRLQCRLATGAGGEICLHACEDNTYRVSERDDYSRLQRLARIGYWSWNLVNGEMFWSGEMFRILGYDPEKDIPASDLFIEQVHEDDREYVLSVFDSLARSPEKARIDFRICLQGGEERHVNIYIDVQGHHGEATGKIFGTIQDVTETMQNKARLKSERDQALFSSKKKSEFLSRMSHELRTPMNSVLGFSQLMILDEKLDEKYREAVNEIYGAGNHLLRLINDVLDLSRIESGKMMLSIEQVDFTEVINECVSLIRPLATNRSITVNMDYNRKKSLVSLIDRTRLKQVLLNVLSNAVKYNRDEGSIDVFLGESDGTVKLEVRDEGVGIPEHKLSSLFTSFDRLGADKQGIEGTGIGLVIAGNLVKMMNGSIDVESEPGKGTRVKIQFPLLSSLDNPDQVIERWSDMVNEKKFRILHIDDNPANLKLVSHALSEQDGILLVSCSDAFQGIGVAAKMKPDLVLLDIHLPILDGFDVIRQLKLNPATEKTPVYALTAGVFGEKHILDSGFDAYFSKPLDVEMFMDRITPLLKNAS